MKILNKVIPILMHFRPCLPLKSLFRLKLERCILHNLKPHAIQWNVTQLMMLNSFQQYIADILFQRSNVIQSDVGSQKEVH